MLVPSKLTLYILLSTQGHDTRPVYFTPKTSFDSLSQLYILRTRREKPYITLIYDSLITCYIDFISIPYSIGKVAIHVKTFGTF